MLSTTCAYCEVFSNFSFRWGQIGPISEYVNAAAACDHCGRLSIVVGTPIADHYPGWSDQQYVLRTLETAKDVVWWPRVGTAPRFEDVPDHIARAAREAYANASIGSNMSAILMARTSIEATAKDQKIQGKNLYEKIDGLRAAGLIRPGIAEQAHEVRHAGNDMAHGDIDVQPDRTDADEILALMAEVLNEVYEAPARLKRVKEKRQKAAS